MASTIKLKNGSGAPLASDLVQGEPALDLTNKRLYTEDSLGAVIEVGTNPTSLTTGDITATGTTTITTADINGGAIDGTTIGGTTTAAGSFTTLQADTSLNVDGTVTADGLTVDGDVTISDTSVLLDLMESDTTDVNTRFQQSGGDLLIRTLNDAKSAVTTRLAIDHATGDISFYEDTGTTAKFFWDASAESLGIGTTSPDTQLTTYKASTASDVEYIKMSMPSWGTSTNYFKSLVWDDSGNTVAGIGAAYDGSKTNIHFHSQYNSGFKTTSDVTMSIMGNGNVGIGRTPVSTLHVEDAVSTVYSSSALPDSADCILAIGNKQTSETTNDHCTLQFNVNGGTHNRVGAISFVAENSANRKGALAFSVDNGTTREEAMRIDSSGNLLISGTNTTPNTNSAGTTADNEMALRNDGLALFSAYKATASSGVVMDINRTSTDGGILGFRKNGVEVGSIGTFGGNAYFGNGDTGIRPNAATDAIYPVSVSGGGTARDAAISLGDSGTRFKDLYLSGGIKAGSNNLLRFDDSGAGRVMIGSSTAGDTSGITAFIRGSASSTTSYFHWNRTDTALAGTAALFQNANTTVGTIQYTNTATSYNTSSDYRLKENVVDMTGAVDRLKALNPSQFNFIADPDRTVDGFLAHEVADVVPEAVTGTKDAMRTEEYEVTPAVLDDDGNVVTEAVMGTREVPDYQGIDQSKLVPLLTGALQEAIARIETLEAEVATLQGN